MRGLFQHSKSTDEYLQAPISHGFVQESVLSGNISVHPYYALQSTILNRQSTKDHERKIQQICLVSFSCILSLNSRIILPGIIGSWWVSLGPDCKHTLIDWLKIRWLIHISACLVINTIRGTDQPVSREDKLQRAFQPLFCCGHFPLRYHSIVHCPAIAACPNPSRSKTRPAIDARACLVVEVPRVSIIFAGDPDIVCSTKLELGILGLFLLFLVFHWPTFPTWHHVCGKLEAKSIRSFNQTI